VNRSEMPEQDLPGPLPDVYRAIAFSMIPSDASEREARAWLISQLPTLAPEIARVICRVHMEDELLRAWRVAEAHPLADVSQDNGQGNLS
jgi:hypothetical protein